MLVARLFHTRFPNSGRPFSYARIVPLENTCFPYKNVDTPIPKRTSTCQQDLMSVFCLQLLRISSSLDDFVPCAEGVWMSVSPQIHQHSLVSRMPGLGGLQRVVALCCSHTTPSRKRMKRLRDLAISGQSFKCSFPLLESRFMLKNRNRSGVVLKNRKQVSSSDSTSQGFVTGLMSF